VSSAAHAVASVGAGYIGRFAPSPTGPLHAGSLVAALASWLDARAHGGTWLVRIEDLDTPRCVPGADAEILRQLAACGLLPDAPPVYQSQRKALYQAALDQLIAQGTAYPCACSRKDIEDAWHARGIHKPRHGELVYPGTCRHGLQGKTARAWRFLTDFYEPNRPLAQRNTAQAATKSIVIQDPQDTLLHWQDRRLGAQQQDVQAQVGDFVLRRADALWAYQLAVVVDDAAQGITHIVRGEDLADNTARQILLQRALGYATPQYLHTPLVLATDGQKLSKQNGAQALDTSAAVACLASLMQAAQVLGLSVPSHCTSLDSLLSVCIAQWPHKL
jgi:glutamyl-Q tRNA(Asp) synthetase